LTDDIFAPLLQVELGIKSHDSIDLIQRGAGLFGNVFQNLAGEIPVQLLRPLQNGDQSSFSSPHFFKDFVERSQIQGFRT
jgi:hypothetical protein